MQVSVEGGTHAGWRIVRMVTRADWTCENGHRNRYYWNPCPVCGAPRKET